MTLGQLERVVEPEGWAAPRERSAAFKAARGTLTFARKKPLGFACALVVLALIVVGDLVPVTVNGALDLLGIDPRLPYVADVIAPFRYDKINLGERLEGSSWRHPLGTDDLGRDTLSRLVYGARVSVIVPVGAVLITEALAATIGIMSAYYGGWLDKGAQRIVDVFQALPGLVVLISILGLFGSGLWQLVVVIGVLSGPPASRLIRGQVLSVMASPYIEAARVIGARDGRIMVRYVLPNVMALIILGSTLRLGAVVLMEASLSFLGFGLRPPFPSWGQMLSIQGREHMRSAPGLAIYPGLAIALVVFAYNLFGDALRDTLDPRLRGSR
jgi:peptide/nickel transport system permease protein